jgi:hypothetical protein
MCFKKTQPPQVKLSIGAIELGFNELTASKALENAIENRKFEISLYWHRATYFWVFIGLIWAALGKVLSDLHALDRGFSISGTQTFILFFITCMGFCLSFAWYLVNKGSKFWQENWELQIAYLEEFLMGPSFSINLSKTADTSSINPFNNPLGADSYSVSKINQLISLANLVLWLLLASAIFLYSMHKAWNRWDSIWCNQFVLLFAFATTSVLSIIFSLVAASYCKSHSGGNAVYYSKKVANYPKKNS